MIMNESKKLSANAVGGKTARACDSCLRRRARWYCPADDAFLCQACDSSVHSANQLASRHERVRLETASFKADPEISQTSPPSWHQGFTKKARTPRTHNKPEIKMVNHNCPLPPLVPEIGNEFEEDQEANMNIEDDHLLYRVPEFDPFAVEFCDLLTSNDGVDLVQSEEMVIMNDMAVDSYNTKEETCQDQLGLLTSDMNISEFGVDVESLLGLEENPPVVKKETFDHEFGNWDFEFDQSLMMGDEEEVKKEEVGVEVAESGVDMAMSSEELEKKETKRSVSLRLNYEAVITAWASQRSPWTTGCRPELITDGCWPDCMGMCPKQANSPYGGLPRSGGGDGDREARVMRYKEKRRTRLFSKKIRYEVRKLNAEKRPRMKGRFVKRTTLMGTSFPNYLNN